ncbi:MAG TPA: hypothetical protein VGB56_08135, partial [Flavisolibacter sp.]
MKKLLFMAGLLAGATIATAQGTAGENLRKIVLQKADSVVLGKARLDFAIPDIPAFKALGVDPSNILRPSAAKDFSLMLNNFGDNGFSTIPRDLAVEVAPALFMKPWYTLQEYRENGGLRFLTKSRISLGTNDDAATRVNTISTGFRATLFDKGDFRLDSAFQQRHIFSPMERLQEGLTSRLYDYYKQIGGVVVFAELPEARQDEVRDSIYRVVESSAGFVLDTVVKQSIETYKKQNWNASRMDFAYALLLRSPDTLVSNIKLHRHSFWATLALKPGPRNSWGQLLLGVHQSFVRFDDRWLNEFTGSLRFYAGTNKFKGLLEMQYERRDEKSVSGRSTLFTQLGVEASFFNGMWIQFSTGIFNALEGDNKSAL